MEVTSARRDTAREPALVAALPVATVPGRSAGAGPWVAAGLAGVVTTFVALRPAGTPFVPCPFHAVTGWWCPGCGMTRAVHHLTHADLGAALGSNLLLPVVLGVVVWAWLAWVTPRVAPPPRVVPAWVWGALVAIAVVYGVARNLPVEPLRALAP